ncbi:hypothetical protein ZWY2020_049720 [Hordeum vulgare]|nr:hypothetical protein ZWY2020_049720 [Hordeum vulgare]
MSFKDLEAGVLGPPPLPLPQVVAHGVFQINTKVAALRHLVDALGTPKDTPAPASASAPRGRRPRGSPESRRGTSQAAACRRRGVRVPCSKLAMDFEAALSELQKVQQRIAAAERKVNSSAAAAANAAAPGGGTSAGHEQCTGQTQQQQQQLLSQGTEVEELSRRG